MHFFSKQNYNNNNNNNKIEFRDSEKKSSDFYFCLFALLFVCLSGFFLFSLFFVFVLFCFVFVFVFCFWIFWISMIVWYSKHLKTSYWIVHFLGSTLSCDLLEIRNNYILKSLLLLLLLLFCFVLFIWLFYHSINNIIWKTKIWF